MFLCFFNIYIFIIYYILLYNILCISLYWYPCRGYINLGQKLATHLNRHLSSHINSESVSTEGTHSPCLSVCPSIRFPYDSMQYCLSVLNFSWWNLEYFDIYSMHIKCHQNCATITFSCHRNNRPIRSYLYEDQLWLYIEIT